MGRPSGFLLRVGTILIKVCPGKKTRRRRYADQMLKCERPDLLFAEKCSIFVLPKEETERNRRLPPFLGPACAQNYPALGQNYKALGFIYVPVAQNYKALGQKPSACNRKNPAQKRALRKFTLNLPMHFDALLSPCTYASGGLQFLPKSCCATMSPTAVAGQGLRKSEKKIALPSRAAHERFRAVRGGFRAVRERKRAVRRVPGSARRVPGSARRVSGGARKDRALMLRTKAPLGIFTQLMQAASRRAKSRLCRPCDGRSLCSASSKPVSGFYAG